MSKRWPEGVPVFRDIRWWGRAALFVATDVKAGLIIGINKYGEQCCYRSPHELAALNRDAWALLAIAKAGAR